MVKQIGKSVSFGIKKEAVRGTAESTASAYIAAEKVEFKENIETELNTAALGTLANASDQTVVGKVAQVAIEFKAGLITIGHILRAVFGQAPETTAGTGDNQVHTFEMSNSASQDTFTLFKADLIQDYKFVLGVLESFTIEAALKTVPKFTATFKAKVGATATNTEAFETEEILLHTGFDVKFGDDIATLDSGDAICVRSLKLDVNKANEEDYCVADTSPKDILAGIVSVTGQMVIAYENATYRNLLLNNTAKAMQITFAGGVAEQGLVIKLPKVKLTGSTPSTEPNAVVTETIDFTALLDTTTVKQITAVLTNEEADGTY